MKKNWLSDSLDPGLLQKMSKVMRIVFILIFGFSMAVSAESYAQSTKMDIEMKNSTIRNVIEYVEKNSKFIFLYKNEDFNVDKKVDLNLKGATIDEILDIIFDEESVEYDIYDRQIVVRKAEKMALRSQQGTRKITGIVSDLEGGPIPGASVVVAGTTVGTVTNIEGEFNLEIPESAESILVSFVGMKAQEIPVANKTSFTIIMESDIEGIDEVIVVGYGTQKKVNLTASVSQVDGEIVEDRAVANTAQALQGAVPNLIISNTNSGGEPGAAMDLNIRGLVTASGSGSVSDAEPYVLVDGVEMSINDIDPEDIESVSVLKDASAASIYGSRAAGGVILITTKSGKNMDGGIKIAYSNNFSWATPTAWPEQANALDFAYTMNDAYTNNGTNPIWNEEELGWIQMNLENPGSAQTVGVKADGKNWDVSSGGLNATAATDWKDFLFEDWTGRQKHNLNFTGGTEKLNYYMSAGFYDEDGFHAQTEDSYSRYNLDVKLNAKPYEWLEFSLLTKFIKSESRQPWDYRYGTGRIFDILSKIKPTMPIVDPIYGEPMVGAYYPTWDTQWQEKENNQLAIMPRVVIEPLKGWKINLEYNYKRNNNKTLQTALQYEYMLADGSTATTPSAAETQVRSYLYTNEYFSPNLYTSYTKSFGDHNFKVMAGYQSELQEYYNLNTKALGLITDNIPSISTAVGEITSSDGISHWSTQSLFSRLNYDYKGKYLLEVSYRRDGSSKFADGSRWAGFPSFSAGYNVAKENFWPLQDHIQTFKLRGSYGTLGNQNVSNYLYLSTMGVNQGTYLFDGEWDYYVTTPDLVSNSLTWETVQSTDFGVDILALDGKLSGSFDWYRSDIEDMTAQGESLPSVLGTDAPLTNVGVFRTQGWEIEIGWKQKIKEFGYNVRFVLSDYKRTVVEYPNPNKLLSDYYEGKELGEIWGLEWDGWFQTQDEIDNHDIDQSTLVGWALSPGDTKYVDQNGDMQIDNGSNTLDDPGDRKVIGNTTPRYQYGLSLGADWKGFDFSMFIQGVGKRDFYIGGTAFRGPANGPYHANVMEYHLDYWRDETSALGANTDAFWAKPYAANPGRNNKNYKYSVDRYVADASYIRLKSIQIGYTLPKHLTQKIMLDRVRVFVTGENLWTKTDFPMYDPETLKGNFSNAVSYPLSKTISAGINVSL